MNETKENSTLYQTIEDYKVSFRLLRQNFWPFFIVLLIGTAVYYGMEIIFRYTIFESIVMFIPLRFQPITYSVLKLPGDSFLFGFFGCAMGLGYDIMSSGDGFTQVRNSIYYIKKFWLKFFIFGFISNIIMYILRLIPRVYITTEISIISRIFGAMWYISLSESNASLANQNSVLKALQENFILLKNKFSRILITFGIYYVIFLLPRTIVGVYYNLHEWPAFGFEQPLYMTMHILTLIYIFIGFPVFAFLSIGIYNSELKFRELDKI